MPFADSDGARVHYETTGEGPPLALVLPQSSGPEGRGALLAGLARQHRVITFSQRGTGRSDPAPAHQPMAALAADLEAVLDRLGAQRTALVCHSTGCGVGISLAAARPGRVNALVLVSPWTHGDPYLTHMQALRKAAVRTLDPKHYARFNAALLFPPEYRRGHEAGFATLAARAEPQDADDLARRLDAIVAFDARPLWARIGCPVQVMVARDDQLMPPWFARDTAAGIPGASLLELDGGGHMLPETRAAALVEAVLAFLECAGMPPA